MAKWTVRYSIPILTDCSKHFDSEEQAYEFFDKLKKDSRVKNLRMT